MAMLLGIFLHGALAYMDAPWIVQDPAGAEWYGLAVSSIHGFRMPLFFMLSGFFCAMLFAKRGFGGLLSHRAKRIAIPLGIGCATIIPAMWAAIIGVSVLTPAPPPPDPTQDIWAASSSGDVDSVMGHLAKGADPDEADPTYQTTPLGWAAFQDHPEVVGVLLDAGADPNRVYAGGSTALHAASFFGRADCASLLLESGADPTIPNPQGETPLELLDHNRGVTEMIAGMFQLEIDFEVVAAERERIRPLIEQRLAEMGVDEAELLEETAPDRTGQLINALTGFPVFHHLWFLWFLCWFVAGFAAIAALARRVPLSVPAWLVSMPWCLLCLIPLTALTQSWQRGEGGPAFGPDTSIGLLPMWHVAAHYAVFFAFGAILFGSRGASVRLGSGWFITLPLALGVLPVAMSFTFDEAWAIELVADEGTRGGIAALSQASFAWFAIFGFLGLFEAILSKERAWVRYLSDSSYWLYLVHLPPMIVAQWLLIRVDMPAFAKFTLLVVSITALCLLSYHFLVRYTVIGRTLNGPRNRPSPERAIDSTG